MKAMRPGYNATYADAGAQHWVLWRGQIARHARRRLALAVWSVLAKQLLS
jgi:hypothetical protein